MLLQVEPYMALREAPHLYSTIHGAIFRDLQETWVLFDENQLGFIFVSSNLDMDLEGSMIYS